MDIGEKINAAFKYFQEGNLEQAEKECLEILAIEPENSEILHLLGVTCYHTGAFDRAVEYLRTALHIDDQNADIYYDLGSVLQDQGSLDEALKVYQRALEIEPDHPDAHNNIGMVLHDLGQIDKAISHYQKAIELTPQSAIIHNNIALAYEENSESKKAIAHYGKAIQIDPNYADAHVNVGNVFLKEENPDTAYAYFFKAVQLNPNCAEAYSGMAQILLGKGKFAEALPLLGRLLMFFPESPEIHNNLGNALGEIWHLEDAVKHLQRAVELNPDFAEAHANLGNTLFKMGNPDEGIEHINKALQLRPDMFEAVNNLGNIFKEKGEFREAVTCYRKALLLKPDNADARFNIAVIDLMQGRFAEGWEGYEYRFQVKGARTRKLPQPLWDGSPLQGKRVLVYAEQGIGDEIMFASCLPDLMKQAALCIIECDKRLLPLFERSFTGAEIISRLEKDGYPPDLPHADCRLAAGSLPKFLRTGITRFPVRKSYLIPDREKMEEWKRRYRELGEGLKVGISWRGGGTPDMIRVRSTSLEQWHDIFSVDGVHFVSLQYGDCSEELKKAEDELNVKIHDWEDGNPLKDLDAFAAKIAALDLVISTDSATVHMAGALGVPVWVLLPHVCEWRWMLHFEDTPWYDSVRLFRQERRGEWAGVFERVLTALRDSAAAGEVKDLKVAKSYKAQIES